MRYKDRLWLICTVNDHLHVFSDRLQHVLKRGVAERVYDFIDSRDEVGVFDGESVQFPVVDTKSKRSIKYRSQPYRQGSFRGRGRDPVVGEHFVDLCLNDMPSLGYLSVRVLSYRTKSRDDFNSVFYCRDLSKVTWPHVLMVTQHGVNWRATRLRYICEVEFSNLVWVVACDRRVILLLSLFPEGWDVCSRFEINCKSKLRCYHWLWVGIEWAKIMVLGIRRGRVVNLSIKSLNCLLGWILNILFVAVMLYEIGNQRNGSTTAVPSRKAVTVTQA